MRDAATTVMEQCEVLGGMSGEPGVLTRPYGSRAMGEVNGVVSGWMREAGMTVRQDAIGNLIGRYEGSGEKTLILGSHLDTVRDAGKYDGILGVMVAIACVQDLHDYCEVHIEQGPVLEELGLPVGVVSAINGQSRVGCTFSGKAGHAGTVPMEGRRDALCAAAEFVVEVERAARRE